MYKMRFVLFHYISRSHFRGLSPDEIHLRVNRTEGQPCLEDEEYAAIEKKAGPNYSKDHGYDRVTWAADDCNYSDRHARSNEHSQAQIKGNHRPLQNTRTAGELVQLGEDDRLPFRSFPNFIAAFRGQLLEFV